MQFRQAAVLVGIKRIEKTAVEGVTIDDCGPMTWLYTAMVEALIWGALT